MAPLKSVALRETCKQLRDDRRLLSPRLMSESVPPKWLETGALSLCVYEGNRGRFDLTVALGHRPDRLTMRVAAEGGDTAMVQRLLEMGLPPP